MCMNWPCHNFVDGLSYKCIQCVLKKVKLINYDCLPILMLLYIMLFVMLTYLMLLSALCNAVCIMLLLFLLLIFANAFCFMPCLRLMTHSLFISSIIFIMPSAFNLLVFPNYMFTPFFILKGYDIKGYVSWRNST